MNRRCTTWLVLCRVEGGVTGTREAFLKGNDGLVRVFASAVEAAEVAADLNAHHRHQPFSTARFTYRPVPGPAMS